MLELDRKQESRTARKLNRVVGDKEDGGASFFLCQINNFVPPQPLTQPHFSLFTHFTTLSQLIVGIRLKPTPLPTSLPVPPIIPSMIDNDNNKSLSPAPLDNDTSLIRRSTKIRHTPNRYGVLAYHTALLNVA